MSSVKERTVLADILQRWKGEAPEKGKWVGELKWQDEVEYAPVLDGDDGRVMMVEGDAVAVKSFMFTFDLLTFSWVLIHPLVCLSVRGEGAGVPRVGWGIFDYFTRKVYEVHEEACKDGGYVKYVPWADVKVEEADGKTTIKWKEQQVWMVHDSSIEYQYQKTVFRLNTSSWDWEHDDVGTVGEKPQSDEVVRLASEVQRLTDELKKKEELIEDKQKEIDRLAAEPSQQPPANTTRLLEMQAELDVAQNSRAVVEKELGDVKANLDALKNKSLTDLAELQAKLKAAESRCANVQANGRNINSTKAIQDAKNAQENAEKKLAVVQAELDSVLQEKINKAENKDKEERTSQAKQMIKSYINQVRSMLVDEKNQIRATLNLEKHIIIACFVIVYHLKTLTGFLDSNDPLYNVPSIIHHGLCAAIATSSRALPTKSKTAKRADSEVPFEEWSAPFVTKLERLYKDDIPGIVTKITNEISDWTSVQLGSLVAASMMTTPTKPVLNAQSQKMAKFKDLLLGQGNFSIKT